MRYTQDQYNECELKVKEWLRKKYPGQGFTTSVFQRSSVAHSDDDTIHAFGRDGQTFQFRMCDVIKGIFSPT